MSSSSTMWRDAISSLNACLKAYLLPSWSAIRRRLRPTRFSIFRSTRAKYAGIVFAFLFVLLLVYNKPSARDLQSIKVAEVALQSSTRDHARSFEAVDSFADYKHRATCNVSSLDLYRPYSQRCNNRNSLITAMSSGGRVGFDAPYMSRGCDMRWLTSEQVCEILGRFDKVLLVGDSMLRHVVGSINILVRKDIGFGAVTDWNFSPEERKKCFCNEQFDVKSCSVQGIYKTLDVMTNDEKSMSCKNPINVMMETILRLPIPSEEITRLKADISPTSSKPIAFVFGHGLWSDLDSAKTMEWLDIILEAINDEIGHDWKGLFVTPNSAGKEKPDEWIVSQGNKALMLFEETIRFRVKEKGLEHLGTWNMSIQATKHDGVHLDMRGNLVKAMMILNWLSMLEY